MKKQEVAKIEEMLRARWQKICGHIGSWDADDHNAQESYDEWIELVYSIGAEDCEPGDFSLESKGCVDIDSPYFDNNVVRIPIDTAKKILVLGLP